MPEILVASHNPGHADLLETHLMSDGHRVVRVEDGRGALEYLRTNTPSLMILEGDLPLMDGLEICSRVKSVKRLRNVPVLMWEEQVRDAILGVGVVKPDAVLSRVTAWPEFRLVVRRLLLGKDVTGTRELSSAL